MQHQQHQQLQSQLCAPTHQQPLQGHLPPGMPRGMAAAETQQESKEAIRAAISFIKSSSNLPLSVERVTAVAAKLLQAKRCLHQQQHPHPQLHCPEGSPLQSSLRTLSSSSSSDLTGIYAVPLPAGAGPAAVAPGAPAAAAAGGGVWLQQARQHTINHSTSTAQRTSMRRPCPKRATSAPVLPSCSSLEAAAAQAATGQSRQQQQALLKARKLCQVDGCATNLSASTTYAMRHRVCSRHMMEAAVVLRAKKPLELFRFCNLCCKFEQLSCFEGLKRSCSASLAAMADHNRQALMKAALQPLQQQQQGSCMVPPQLPAASATWLNQLPLQQQQHNLQQLPLQHQHQHQQQSSMQLQPQDIDFEKLLLQELAASGLVEGPSSATCTSDTGPDPFWVSQLQECSTAELAMADNFLCGLLSAHCSNTLDVFGADQAGKAASEPLPSVAQTPTCSIGSGPGWQLLQQQSEPAAAAAGAPAADRAASGDLGDLWCKLQSPAPEEEAMVAARDTLAAPAAAGMGQLAAMQQHQQDEALDDLTLFLHDDYMPPAAAQVPAGSYEVFRDVAPCALPSTSAAAAAAAGGAERGHQQPTAAAAAKAGAQAAVGQQTAAVSVNAASLELRLQQLQQEAQQMRQMIEALRGQQPATASAPSS